MKNGERMNKEQSIYTQVNCTIAFSTKWATRIKAYIAKIFVTLHNFLFELKLLISTGKWTVCVCAAIIKYCVKIFLN